MKYVFRWFLTKWAVLILIRASKNQWFKMTSYETLEKLKIEDYSDDGNSVTYILFKRFNR